MFCWMKHVQQCFSLLSKMDQRNKFFSRADRKHTDCLLQQLGCRNTAVICWHMPIRMWERGWNINPTGKFSSWRKSTTIWEVLMQNNNIPFAWKDSAVFSHKCICCLEKYTRAWCTFSYFSFEKSSFIFITYHPQDYAAI